MKIFDLGGLFSLGINRGYHVSGVLVRSDLGEHLVSVKLVPRDVMRYIKMDPLNSPGTCLVGNTIVTLQHRIYRGVGI